VALDVSYWSSERFGTTWPFIASVQHRLAALPVGTLVGALAVPFAAESTDHGTNTKGGGFAWGNPRATLTYVVTRGAVTPFIGARIGAPIASAGDENADLIVERAGA